VSATAFPIGEQSLFVAVKQTALDRYRSGDLFRGLYPYTIASMIQNYRGIEGSFRSLLHALSHRLPKSASTEGNAAVTPELSVSALTALRASSPQQPSRKFVGGGGGGGLVRKSSTLALGTLDSKSDKSADILSSNR